MRHQTSFDPDRYVDGEYGAEQADRIRDELDENAELAQHVNELERINQLLRGSAKSVSAPESLHESLSRITGDAVDGELSARMSRRRWLAAGGAALTAGVAGVVGFALHRQYSQSVVPSRVADTFFKDFETYLVKDRTLDVQETDLVRIARWYAPRLPFTLPPISSSGAGASLVGGRLCWLLERRLASLSFDSADGPIVLYISRAEGLDLPAGGKTDSFGNDITWHRSASSTSLIWTNDGLLMAMVGTQEISKLKRIARSIVS